MHSRPGQPLKLPGRVVSGAWLVTQPPARTRLSAEGLRQEAGFRFPHFRGLIFRSLMRTYNDERPIPIISAPSGTLTAILPMCDFSALLVHPDSNETGWMRAKNLGEMELAQTTAKTIAQNCAELRKALFCRILAQLALLGSLASSANRPSFRTLNPVP